MSEETVPTIRFLLAQTTAPIRTTDPRLLATFPENHPTNYFFLAFPVTADGCLIPIETATQLMRLIADDPLYANFELARILSVETDGTNGIPGPSIGECPDFQETLQEVFEALVTSPGFREVPDRVVEGRVIVLRLLNEVLRQMAETHPNRPEAIPPLILKRMRDKGPYCLLMDGLVLSRSSDEARRLADELILSTAAHALCPMRTLVNDLEEENY